MRLPVDSHANFNHYTSMLTASLNSRTACINLDLSKHVHPHLSNLVLIFVYWFNIVVADLCYYEAEFLRKTMMAFFS